MKYEFEKPNDRRAVELMNAAAEGVMREVPDVVLGFGMSDEFRYVYMRERERERDGGGS